MLKLFKDCLELDLWQRKCWKSSRKFIKIVGLYSNFVLVYFQLRKKMGNVMIIYFLLVDKIRYSFEIRFYLFLLKDIILKQKIKIFLWVIL